MGKIKSNIDGTSKFEEDVENSYGEIISKKGTNTIYNRRYGKITIKKYDEDSNYKLTGAEFTLTSGNIKIPSTGYHDNNDDNKYKYRLEKIPYGITFTLQETKAPDGYDIRIQDGYNKETGRVVLGTVKVTRSTTSDTTIYKDLINNKTYNIESKSIILSIKNRKYINISGYVWEDIGDDTKENKKVSDDVYRADLGDKKIEGIKVTLWYKGALKDTTYTDENGNYKFKKLIAGELNNYYVLFDYSTYDKVANTEEEYKKGKNLYRPVVQKFATANGSKALTNYILPTEDGEMLEKNLYRANTGTNTQENFFTTIEDDNFDSWTFIDTAEKDTYPTLHNVNLGIREMLRPSFTISQDIAYADISINGYSYRYIYGGTDNSKEKMAPIVNWQSERDISAYTRDIYPSYIAQDVASKGSLDVTVTYRIDIKNNTTWDIQALYREKYMKVNNLEVIYDASRYTLGKDPNLTNPWGGYISNNEGHAYATTEGLGLLNKDENGNEVGIATEETKSAYITFKVKKDAIAKILNNPEGIVENNPTNAIATVQHAYTRYDYSWNNPKDDSDSIKRQNLTFGYWCIDGLDSNGKAREEINGKLHYTVPEQKNGEAPYLIFKLGETKTISGKVFEDTNEKQTTNEVVGDGKYGNNENVVQNVTVELLEATVDDNGNVTSVSDQPATLYRTAYEKGEDGGYIDTGSYSDEGYTEVKDTENNDITGVFTKSASTTTQSDGTYSFKGVVPGEYYIRFTYGDGTQKLYDSQGVQIDIKDPNDKTASEYEGMSEYGISSEDYKSTIATFSDNGKSAQDIFGDNYNKGEAIWYLNYLNIKDNYNLAVDDSIDQNSMKKIRYAIMESEAETVTATTPRISIKIEDSGENEGNVITGKNQDGEVIQGTYPHEVGRMSFGIIKKPEVRIDIKKEISNVKLTLQNGQILINGNPSSQNLPYVANLDTTWSSTGSGYVKVEMDNPYIYGSTLELQYLLTITNNSDVTYIGDNYYKYGDNSGCEIARVNITELMEYLDPKLKFESKDNIDKIEEKQNSDGLDEEHKTALKTLADKYDPDLLSAYKLIYKLEDDDTHTNDPHFLYTTNDPKEENKKNSSTTVKVTASKILSMQDDDLEFISYTQVLGLHIYNDTYRDPTSLPVAKATEETGTAGGSGSGTTDPSGGTSSSTIAYEGIPTASAKITVTPSTGADKNMTYYIAGLILLISLGAVIVCIKKIRK